MEIYYEGRRITDFVITRKCIVRDTAGDRCDSLELEFENSGVWFGWEPAEDDQIIVEHDGYDSGIMYVNTVIPEDGRFRILATSLPCSARRKAYASFYKQTIEDIMRTCAAESGMDIQILGIDKQTIVPYIERNNEGCGAFLSKLLMLEGAALKCVNGKYTAIGYEYAQDRNPEQTIRIMDDQQGFRFRAEGTAIRSVTVKTPYALGTATDTAVPETHANITISKLPALDNAQAGKWAKNKLLHINRNMESVTIQSTFNPGASAMLRVDIIGNTEANGSWMIDTAEHDLKNETTTILLKRCIWTIQ